MGMVGCFTAISEMNLQRLQDDPDIIEQFIDPDDGASTPPPSLDVDKAWHGIHYLLTGTAYGGDEPLSLAVIGGEEIGPEVGYGSARFLTPSQVSRVASALAEVSTEDLKKRFNPQDMTAKEIYPDDIWVRDGDVALDYLLEWYEPLVAFYRQAAARRDGVLQWLS